MTAIPANTAHAADALTQEQWNEIIDPIARPNQARPSQPMAAPPSSDDLMERLRRDDLERRVRNLENERLGRER